MKVIACISLMFLVACNPPMLITREGRFDDAVKKLAAASTDEERFYPLTTAANLLKKGEKQVVLEYFDLCRSFWKIDRGRLDLWAKEVEAGKTPDFGANLFY